MIKCHQCDSEVAENDAFCPFCGISLQPVAVPTDEDEFASTIMMPAPVPVSANAKADGVTVEDNEPIIEAVEVPDTQPQVEAIPETAVPEREQVDLDDIPTPQALAELQQADEERED